MAVQAGGLEALRLSTPNLREVLAEFGQRQGLPGRRPPLVDAPRPGNPPDAVQFATARIAGGEISVCVEASPNETSRTDELGDLMRNINRMAEG